MQILFKAFFTETRDVHEVTVFLSNFVPNLPSMTQIKNNHLAIQINQNQSPIFFQLLMKTIMTFCSIWAFFWHKWVTGIIFSDHLFDFGSSFKCHTQRMENRYYTFRPFAWLWTYFQVPHRKDGKNQLDFQMQNFRLNPLKKKLIKKNQISRNSPSCKWGNFFSIPQKESFWEPIEI